jgi:dipeptidyl aminopeptidase/acylaminoacyl peptidase
VSELQASEPTTMRAPITAAMVATTRSLADPRVSPDGRRVAWVESHAGRADLVRSDLDGGGPRIVVTGDTAVASGAGAFAWAGPDRLVHVAADGRLVVVSAEGGPPRPLTRDGRAAAPAVSADGRLVACVIERDDVCDIAVVPLDGSAWPERISTGAAWAFDPAWSADSRSVAWHEWDAFDMPWDASRIAVRELGGAASVVPAADGTAGGFSVGQPRFSPDGRHLAWVADDDGWLRVRVAAADGTGVRPLVDEQHEHAEPTWGPGQRSWAWSPDGRAIAYCRNESGYGRLVAAAVPARRLRRRSAPRELAKAWHLGLDWSVPGEVLAVRTGGVTVPQVVATAVDGTGRRVLARGAPAGFEAHDGWDGPVEPEPVTWLGGDGQPVHGLVYRGRGVEPGTGPVLVWIHGGPTGQATAQWSGRIQHFVAHGWTVLAPNPRGSTGYGRAYRAAMDLRWGELDVADIAAGIRRVEQLGVGDRRRVAVLGGSAGGFAALLVCAHHGSLVRAGVSLYGIGDLFALYETTHRYEAHSDRRLLGPRPAAATRFRERSPITHAAAIRVPMLLLHGSRDPAVPPEQSAALAAAIASAGTPVEHHVYEGEGHGWSRPETVRDELGRVERFLQRWVLGR